MTLRTSFSSEAEEIPLVLGLADASARLSQVGGKGASLAQMAAAGLPVPHGFHITTAAYRRFVAENMLQERIQAIISQLADEQPAALEDASRQITQLFIEGTIPDEVATAIRLAYTELGEGCLPVAVRSSATAEDLPDLSFAGQQDTYLNMHGEAMVLDAVKRCWASLWTARAIGYRARQGLASEDVYLAVVVQELVAADAAGILFTVNPLTGKDDQMMVNAAWGLGEAIVGGLVTPDTLLVEKGSGRIVQQEITNKNVMTVRTSDGTSEQPVPADRSSVAVLIDADVLELVRLGVRIEELYAQPMDIEWAMQGKQIFIVQARPITTLRPRTEVWNDSLGIDALWTNGNLGEAVPDVMTPSTWSLVQIFMAEATSPMFADGIKEYLPIANIGGRFYLNLSMTLTIAGIFGIGKKRLLVSVEEAFGHIPEDMEIPMLKMPRLRMLRTLLSVIMRVTKRVRANQKKLKVFLTESINQCEVLRFRIQGATTQAALEGIWKIELEPFFRQSSAMLEAATRQDRNALVMVRKDLCKLVGDADANALLSGMHVGSSRLASLGPLVGLAQLERGEIDQATFAREYGHRGPHEFEVSLPRPGEDPHWIEKQMAGLREAPIDVQTLLTRQEEAQGAAWERFHQRYPHKEAGMRQRIARAYTVFHARESARSEVIRAFGVLRAFILRAGELTGHGEALFFLSIDELIGVLGGNQTPLKQIPVRQATYERYCSLPAYPTLIRGHFDPFEWAANPERRSDVFDESRKTPQYEKDIITGFAGVEGIVEGKARVITSMDEGEQLEAGEIMVTIVTNVGWTPLFPRAAAIVTDVGAPLSHAAIVARELGIPAVVGCGNATMRVHTGDWLRVNGKQGTVEILKPASTE